MYDIIYLNHKCGIGLQGNSSPRHKTPTMIDKRNEKIRSPFFRSFYSLVDWQKKQIYTSFKL